jgi:putative transposase
MVSKPSPPEAIELLQNQSPRRLISHSHPRPKGRGFQVVNEDHTSKTCPICRAIENHERIYRGLFKCHKHNIVLSADLVGAFNILAKRKSITPSPALTGVGVTLLRPGAG